MRYRPDIDGLRAVAILPVVLFHADVAWMPGGFVGVDVFFVISGYLITSLIVAEIAEGRFRIADFYRRRALRILPAYIVTMAATLAAGWVLLFPDEARAFGRSLLWASLFVSNVHFWRVSDYFDPDLGTAPLLHTWTLSVEEQFYLLLPLTLILIHRLLAGRWSLVLGALSAASFALCLWATADHEAAAFYLLPMRAWEFGLGALVATGGGALAARAGQGTRTALACLGLGLIAVAMATFDGDTTFPGAAALLPAGGAALVVAAAEGTVAGRLLSVRPMVWTGLISYSLYLWHWPVITFWKIGVAPVLSATDTVLVIALSVALAGLSWALVETPFRSGRLRRARARTVNAGAVAALLLAAVAGALAAGAGAGRWGNLPPRLARIADYIDYRADLPIHPCLIHARVPGRASAFDPEACLAPDPDRPTLLVLGDSHAEHLLPALEAALPGVNVQAAAATGCRPLLGLEGDWYCPAVMRPAIEDHVPAAGAGVVLLSARWREEDIAPLQETVAFLAAHADEVVILGPTPEYLDAFPRLLVRALRSGRDPDRFLDPEVRALDRRMAATDWGRARYVSLWDLICEDGCRHLTAEGVPYFADYGHYTRAAAREIARDLVRDAGIAPDPARFPDAGTERGAPEGTPRGSDQDPPVRR